MGVLGGVISDPKHFVADFSIPNEHFSLLNFRKKGGVTPIRKNFVADFCTLRKKHYTVFRNEDGGGGVRGRLEVFRKFIQNGTVNRT